MMTRRGVLVESLKFAGLFAGAVLFSGCGDDSGGTAGAKPSAELIDLDKKAAEARAKNDAAKTK
jgi:hypothetical protein